MEGNNASVKGITVTEERSRSGTTAVVSQDDDVDPAPVGYNMIELCAYPTHSPAALLFFSFWRARRS